MFLWGVAKEVQIGIHNYFKKRRKISNKQPKAIFIRTRKRKNKLRPKRAEEKK